MKIETYRGINNRLELKETQRRLEFAIHIDTSPADLGFVAYERSFAAKLDATLTGESRITTGDERFDKKIHLTSANYFAAASFFQSQDNRAALTQLLQYVGFVEVSKTWTCVTASMYFSRWERPDLAKIVEVGIPQLALLGGISADYPKPFGSGEAETKKAIERLATFLRQKNAMGAAIVASLPGLAPLAYIYIGGWRFGLVSFPTIYLLLYLSTVFLEPAFAYIWASFFPVTTWKTFVACKIRNSLVNVNAKIPAETFDSFRYAGFAMADLLLGSCMALVSGALYSSLALNTRSAESIFQYIAVSLPAVWTTELVAGFLLLKVSGMGTQDANPFLAQQRLRLEQQRTAINGNPVPQLESISKIYPTSRESIRAVLLVLAVPILMEANAAAR